MRCGPSRWRRPGARARHGGRWLDRHEHWSFCARTRVWTGDGCASGRAGRSPADGGDGRRLTHVADPVANPDVGTRRRGRPRGRLPPRRPRRRRAGPPRTNRALGPRQTEPSAIGAVIGEGSMGCRDLSWRRRSVIAGYPLDWPGFARHPSPWARPCHSSPAGDLFLHSRSRDALRACGPCRAHRASPRVRWRPRSQWSDRRRGRRRGAARPIPVAPDVRTRYHLRVTDFYGIDAANARIAQVRPSRRSGPARRDRAARERMRAAELYEGTDPAVAAVLRARIRAIVDVRWQATVLRLVDDWGVALRDIGTGTRGPPGARPRGSPAWLCLRLGEDDIARAGTRSRSASTGRQPLSVLPGRPGTLI